MPRAYSHSIDDYMPRLIKYGLNESSEQQPKNSSDVDAQIAELDRQIAELGR